MKLATLMTMLALAPASTAWASGVPQLSVADPLFQEMVKNGTKPNNGQVTVMRDANGKTVVLHLDDMSAPYSASLAPAATAPGMALNPAAGLTPKKAKPAKGRRMPRRAAQQLRHVQARKTW
jgi:hypothetical protein